MQLSKIMLLSGMVVFACQITSTRAALVVPVWYHDSAMTRPVRSPNRSPLLTIDPQTGELFLDSNPNNIVESTPTATDPQSYSKVGGDDVGFISLQLTGPPATDRRLFTLGVGDSVGGVTWGANFAGYFQGKEQMVGITGTGQFLPPGKYALWRYAPNNLPPSGSLVEMGVNFSDSLPGDVIWGRLELITKSDLNNDGSVDAADAGIMFGNWSGAGEGDLNLDFIIDAADAGMLFGDWTGDSTYQSLPEPSHWAITLLAVSAIAVVFRHANAPKNESRAKP